jgi:hypothetical protein
MKQKTSGFSLIEALVFITILSIFFISAMSITLVSLRNMKANEHKIYATKYAEELKEWLKAQKEKDWFAFMEMGSDSGTVYCFYNINGISEWPVSGTCTMPPIYRQLEDRGPSIFKREVLLTKNGTDSVDAKITISWLELGNPYSITVATNFSVWEK